MASSELYDFLPTIVPDYAAQTLSIRPQGEVLEESSKSDVIHVGADGSEERISFGSSAIFYVTLSWNILSESDSGHIHQFYNTASLANGRQRSFKLSYGDGHTYVVRFDSTLPRAGSAPSRYGIRGVRFKVLGRIAD